VKGVTVKDHDVPPPEKVERQGVITDLAIAAAAGGSTGVAGAITTKLLNSPSEPPPEPQPEVILPPGVDKPEK
jgi:hypothetical protein